MVHYISLTCSYLVKPWFLSFQWSLTLIQEDWIPLHPRWKMRMAPWLIFVVDDQRVKLRLKAVRMQARRMLCTRQVTTELRRNRDTVSKFRPRRIQGRRGTKTVSKLPRRRLAKEFVRLDLSVAPPTILQATGSTQCRPRRYARAKIMASSRGRLGTTLFFQKSPIQFEAQ